MEHRKAMLSNLAAALFIHGRIETTVTKAKALRPFAEKIITMAKEAQDATPERALALRRRALSRVRHKEGVRILFQERAAQFIGRDGGYSRIYKLGPRLGDAAEMALIALIEADDEGHGRRRSKAGTKKTAAKPVPAPAITEGATPGEESNTPVATEAPASEESPKPSASETAEPTATETPAPETDSEKKENP